MNDDKVRITLTKKPLASEREEIRQKKHNRNIKILIATSCLVIGIMIGLVVGINNEVKLLSSSNTKLDGIKDLINQYWLYGNEYDDLSTYLDDRAYYGMTYFSDDPYTTYQSKEELEEFTTSINMDFVGVGITYVNHGDYILVERVFKDSPAQKAGILPGDIIHTVDNIDIKGMKSEDIKKLVIGKEGTKVTLGLERQGKDLAFDVIRGYVDSTCYAYEINDNVILEINSFGNNTHNQVIKYLDKYQDKDKLIIDLRNNTGGFQTALEYIAGIFLGDDVLVMREIDKNGNEIESYTKTDVYYDNFKEIAILINDNTASAAEVLTMALVELHPNAYTIGTTSFGKGVVQSTIPFKDGSALKLTTYKWVSPNGIWINDTGIKPDYEVLLDDAIYVAYLPMEDNLSFKYNDINEYIRKSALALRYLGYDIKRVDGLFDDSFNEALKAFESDCQIEVDGILDKDTYDAIVSALKLEYSTNHDKDNQLQKALELIND